MNWTTMRIYLRSNPTLKVLGKLVLGQLVSSAVALMSITTSLIAEFGVDTPLTQSLFTYGSLALVYGSILIYRHQKPLIYFRIEDSGINQMVCRYSMVCQASSFTHLLPLFLREKKSVPAAATTIEEDENLNIEYQILNGESEGVTAST
ncbi:hypothetical protein RYX36_031819 [Vicia faba]